MTPFRFSALPLLAALLGACAVRSTKIPPLPIAMDDDTREVAHTVAAPSTMLARLPGAMVNRAGVVRAVVFPLSYGMRRPAWTEQQIAYGILGVAGDSAQTAQGAAARLLDASAGAFRLNASMVFPALVDPSTSEEQIRKAFSSQDGVRALARRIILPWIYKANLASYDNDGADGLPSSGDDDGDVDLPIVLIETDAFSGSAIADINSVVRTGKNGAFHTRLGRVLVVAVTRKDSRDPDNFIPTAGILRSLGVTAASMFTPANPSGEVSTEAREELGWIRPTTIERSGVYALSNGQAVSIPVTDVPGGRARWLVERGGDRIYAVRMVRRGDGKWIRTEEKTFSASSGYTLALSAQGERGPIARIDNSTATVLLRPM